MHFPQVRRRNAVAFCIYLIARALKLALKVKQWREQNKMRYLKRGETRDWGARRADKRTHSKYPRSKYCKRRQHQKYCAEKKRKYILLHRVVLTGSAWSERVQRDGWLALCFYYYVMFVLCILAGGQEVANGFAQAKHKITCSDINRMVYPTIQYPLPSTKQHHFALSPSLSLFLLFLCSNPPPTRSVSLSCGPTLCARNRSETRIRRAKIRHG